MTFIAWGRTDDLYTECRQCGYAVDDADDTCPACGSSEIAIYSF